MYTITALANSQQRTGEQYLNEKRVNSSRLLQRRWSCDASGDRRSDPPGPVCTEQGWEGRYSDDEKEASRTTFVLCSSLFWPSGIRRIG